MFVILCTQENKSLCLLPKAYGSRFVCLSFCQSFCHSICLWLLFLKDRYKLGAGTTWQYLERDSIKLCFVGMAWFAHLKHCCGTFQTSKTTNLLEVDLLAFWHLDQYNRYSCWQRNYIVNMLSWRTESSLASHNNFGTRSDGSRAHFTARPS